MLYFVWMSLQSCGIWCNNAGLVSLTKQGQLNGPTHPRPLLSQPKFSTTCKHTYCSSFKQQYFWLSVSFISPSIAPHWKKTCPSPNRSATNCPAQTIPNHFLSWARRASLLWAVRPAKPSLLPHSQTSWDMVGSLMPRYSAVYPLQMLVSDFDLSNIDTDNQFLTASCDNSFCYASNFEPQPFPPSPLNLVYQVCLTLKALLRNR